ncbi:MAG: hypothetical protein VW127_06615 [Flavobacteriaceae bacterium]|jgi:hypothetical protein
MKNLNSKTFITIIFIFLFFSCKSSKKDDIDVVEPEITKEDTGNSLNDRFWTNLHLGNYDSISNLIVDHKKYVEKYPKDITIYGNSKAFTSAHLGWLNFWKVSELGNELPDDYNTNLLAQSVFAEKGIEHSDSAIEFFQNAKDLNPLPQIIGFLAVAQRIRPRFPFISNERIQELSESSQLNAAIAVQQWPAFNLFTINYSATVSPHDSYEFANALDAFWLNLEACTGEVIDRENANVERIIEIIENLERDSDNYRACGNTWIAPYNTEGFLLIFADMLVKKGELELATRAYDALKITSTFNTWPYKDLITLRQVNLTENIQHFRSYDELGRQPSVVAGSKISCMVCHQKSGAPRPY